MENRLDEKVLPNNLEAENAILASILLKWESMAEVFSILKADRFYDPRNKLIYQALVTLYSQNVRGDYLSLINELTVEGKLEEAGGAGYIASLTDLVPSAANILHYAKIVVDRATRRDLIDLSIDLKSTAYQLSKDADAILDSAENRIFNLAERNETTVVHSAQEVMVKEFELIQKRIDSKSRFTGIPSGFAKLDTFTSGFQKSELIIIGARPSIGKTALALSMMQHIALEQKISCGFFSLEMPYESIGMRILSQEARVSMQKIRSGLLRVDDITKIQNAAGRWFQCPLYIVDTPNMRLLDLKAMARRMVKNQEVKIIFIDYIGLITTETPNQPVYEQVSEISKSLKALARELEIPIVALCQVARAAEGEPPNLAQLRGSGSVEQDADVVMFLHRERLKEETTSQDATIILAKQRNGATGDIKIRFLPEYSRFENAMEE